MVIALSFAVLAAPLMFAFLVTSSLSLRNKVIIGAMCFACLVLVPLLAIWLGLS